MTAEKFREIRFRAETLQLIDTINRVLEEYEGDGLDVTLRQLFYCLVVDSVIRNVEAEYKKLVRIVTDARDAGQLPWGIFSDRSRETVVQSHWAAPADILDTAANSFRLDRWRNQSNHVEVMLEKQALEGFLLPICEELDVPFTATRGYCSATIVYQAGRRLAAAAAAGKAVYVLYLGDHDPSGVDMSRDLLERLSRYSRSDVVVPRLALNSDQIKRFKLPPQPTKEGDARAAAYVEKHGDRCWELDALDPKVLAATVRSAVERLRDPKIWKTTERREARRRRQLVRVAGQVRGGER